MTLSLELPSSKIIQRHMNTFAVLVLDLLPVSMNISLAHLPSTHFKRVLPHSLLVGVISALGILTGFVPSLSAPASMMFSNAAYAQAAVTPEEVQNYARSVLAIEPIRLQAYNEIKRLTGSGDVPAIACYQPNSLNNLNRDIRSIAVEYCHQSIQIVERNQLTIGRFNTITTTLQSDPDLASRIQDAMVQLQRASSN